MDPIALQAHLQTRLDALNRADLAPSVSRGPYSLEVRFGGHYHVRNLPYGATPEQVDALVAEFGAMPAMAPPKPAASAQRNGRSAQARRYDRLFNEGGEGYNPYRD